LGLLAQVPLPPPNRRVLAVLIILISGLCSGAHARTRFEANYDITLAIDIVNGRASGVATISFTNTSLSSIRTVPVYLVPNHFSKPDEDLNDVTFPHRFPAAFSPGQMSLLQVSANGVDITEELQILKLRSALAPEIPLPEPCAPGSTVILELTYSIIIPHRFGTFGQVDEVIVLNGGWYPHIPLLTQNGFDRQELHTEGSYVLSLSTSESGLLVVGDHMRRTDTRKQESITLSWSGPLPLYFSSPFSLLEEKEEGKVPILHVSRTRDRLTSRTARQVRQAVAAALSDAHLPSSTPPFVILEAPLRETMVIPIRHGILVSDLAFDVLPAESLVRQHHDNVYSAAYSATLMRAADMTLYETLLTLNLLQFVRQARGESDPLFLRRFLRFAEVWGTLEKMGSDPQAHFQNSMFFAPELPAELKRQVELLPRQSLTSPRTAARILFIVLGVTRIENALSLALEQQVPVTEALKSLAHAHEHEFIDLAFISHGTDLELFSVEQRDGAWYARVCKHGLNGPLPMELESGDRHRTKLVTTVCTTDCCDIALGSTKRRPRVLIDPMSVFQQTSDSADHPRRNDRNYLDLKWIISRPYFSMGSGDTFPSMGAELTLQPRFDLRNKAFLGAATTPERVSFLTGWRYGFGRQVRPNYLSHSLSLGIRATVSLQGDFDSSFGPALSWVHYSRQSRFNPYAGNWSFLYAYPVAEEGFKQFGVRVGGQLAQVLGTNPDHVFAFRLQSDFGFGHLPDWDVPSTGGIDGLRAVGATDFSKHQRLGVNLEYRWMVVRNLHLSLARFAYLSGVQLAVFGDGAAIAHNPGHLLAPASMFSDFGFGLRFHMNVFGVLPAMLAVDTAYLLPVGAVQTGGMNYILSFFQPF
jgi:hypothetical protein